MKPETNKKLWAIHNWVGLYVGLVIAVLSITGAAAVFIPEIDHLVHPNLLKVEPKAEKVSLNKTFQQLQGKFQDYRFLGLELPQESDEAWLFNFLKPVEDGSRERVEIAVDPYTGELLGERNTLKSLANFMRQIHVRLYDGIYGRQIVGLAGIGLLISAITGLLIYGKFMKRQFFANIRRGKNIRIVTADWHKVVGISSLLFNLMIALTGAWLGLQPVLMDWLDIEVPNRYEVVEKPYSPEEDQALYLNLESALGQTSIVFSDMVPSSIRPSADGAGLISIAGNIPGTVYERNSSKLVLDKEQLNVQFKFDPRTASGEDQFYYILEPLHFGDFGGLLLKFIYLLFGLTTAALSITGFFIYLKRNEKKLLKKGKSSVAGIMWRYTLLTLLILTIICLLSLFVSYSFASSFASVLVYSMLTWFLLRFFYFKTIRR